MGGRYVVKWSMPFDAESAEDAALQAQATLQDPHNTATCFVVEADEGGRKVIDVGETPHVASPTHTPELKSFGLQGWAWIADSKQIGPRFRTELAARNWRKQSKTQPTLRRRNNF